MTEAVLARSRSESFGVSEISSGVGYRLIGIFLLLLSMLPLYRLVQHPETGGAGIFIGALLEAYYGFMVSGALLVMIAAIAGAVLVSPALVDRLVAGIRRALLALPFMMYLSFFSVLTIVLTLLFSFIILDAKPNIIDAISQLQHARYWAEGKLAGPLNDGGGFWFIQNSLFTKHGWISQYPPGHVALLTLFLLIGAPWAAGPLMAGGSVFFTGLISRRLWPTRPVLTRLPVLLLALSAFFVCISASYMNHVTAAFGICLGTYALLRAWQSDARWAILAGLGFSFSFITRPLSTIAMAGALAFTVPHAAVAKPDLRRFIAITWRAVLGGLPLMAVLFVYNQYFFGGPLKFGYDVALGPDMSLGFHRDPWGNWYGLREAIGYTSSDLITLSINLFETPLPSLLIIGAFLLLAPVKSGINRMIVAWAIAPVVTNFFYWHHGQFMGPRMLHEAAPGWVLLFVVSMVGLYHEIKPNAPGPRRLNYRGAYVTAVLASFAMGWLWLVPHRAATYGGEWLQITRIPKPQTEGPSLIFVHDAWPGRVGMQLATAGLRLDQTETAVRQNPTCRLQQLVDALYRGDQVEAQKIFSTLDMQPRASRLPLLITIVSGDNVRFDRTGRHLDMCVRHIRADGKGILDLTPLLPQGDLPGLPARGPLFVRDLGPERNRELLKLHPDRRPYVYALPAPDAAPVLYEYNEGIHRLWGSQ